MNTRSQKITIWDNVLPQTVTSSTDATPIVVTKTAHGYSTGDIIMIQGHTTNLNANGVFKIVVLTANTFQLYNPLTGLPVAGSGAGAGAGGIMVKMSTNQIPAYTEEFRTQTLQLITTGSATLVIKIAISNGRPGSASDGAAQDVPNFGAPVTATNPYTFAKIIDLDTDDETDGNVGIVASGTDLQKDYEVNINLARYMVPLLTGWSAGRITLILNQTNQQ